MLQHELLGLDRRLPAASFQAPSCKVCLVILVFSFALLLIMSLMLSVTNISNSISITITAIMITMITTIIGPILRLSLAWPSPLFWPNIVSSMEKTF